MTRILSFLLIALSTFVFAQDVQKSEKLFDPSADPSKDLKQAVGNAQKTNKRIILDVGGDWCIWCRRLDAFIKADKDITSALEKDFILLKVNYSKENKNEAFLSQYPKIPGYPHIFVLDKDGKLLHSQDTAELEQDKSYGKDKILAFLKKWVPSNKKGSI